MFILLVCTSLTSIWPTVCCVSTNRCTTLPGDEMMGGCRIMQSSIPTQRGNTPPIADHGVPRSRSLGSWYRSLVTTFRHEKVTVRLCVLQPAGRGPCTEATSDISSLRSRKTHNLAIVARYAYFIVPCFICHPLSVFQRGISQSNKMKDQTAANSGKVCFITFAQIDVQYVRGPSAEPARCIDFG